MLEQSNKLKRLETLCVILLKEIDLVRVESEIDSKVQQQMDEKIEKSILSHDIQDISRMKQNIIESLPMANTIIIMLSL